MLPFNLFLSLTEQKSCRERRNEDRKESTGKGRGGNVREKPRRDHRDEKKDDRRDAKEKRDAKANARER